MKNSKIEHAFFSQRSEKTDEHVLVISGAIGQSSLFYDATSADDVRLELQDVKAKTIRIKLNSGGGSTFEGLEIYNYLKDLDAHVIVEVTALAASAASIIAMGADEVLMRTGSTMMIHNASTFVYGNKEDMLKAQQTLEKIDASVIDVYQSRTGLSSDEIKEMLDNETWFTASEAVEKGFANSLEEKAKETSQVDSKLDLNQLEQMDNNKINTKEVIDVESKSKHLKSLLF
ncbi:head maturation protease, ClpP-related [Staphylococcus haemolyticus]|uniref:head maturation protease, ClpP-related n=1 Tax=Staphylococcus haemolyticus TaxID=1283 RepID=UPI0039BD7C4C